MPVVRRNLKEAGCGEDTNPRAKPRSDEQKLHTRRTRKGRVSKAKRSPILPEFRGVNAADIRGEGNRAYPRRSCRRKGVDVFETERSNNELQEVSRGHSTGNGKGRTINDIDDEDNYLVSDYYIEDGAFGLLRELDEIMYAGTCEEWKGVDSEQLHQAFIKAVTVHCLDGDIQYEPIK